MRDPSRWAADNDRTTPGLAPWWKQVPSEIRAQAYAARHLGPRALADWFIEEVSTEYPDETWPLEATYDKCQTMLAKCPERHQ